MTVSDILSLWREAVPEGWSDTVDRLHYGSEDAPVRRIAVCFRITWANLQEALAWGADMILTHEPIYPDCAGPLPEDAADPVSLAVHELLTRTGTAVFRIHDHAHMFEGDFIHMGFLRATGLMGEVRSQRELRIGFRLLELAHPITTRQIAQLTRDRLNVAHPRMAGSIDTPVTRLILALGGIGDLGYRYLSETDAELLITGEQNELSGAFYASDAAALGMNKSFLLLGHCESERYGMASIAEWLGWLFADPEVRCFSTADTYQYL